MRADTVRSNLIAEMEGALDEDQAVRIPAGRAGYVFRSPQGGRSPAQHIEYLTARMADARARGAPFANSLPTSPAEFETVFRRRREREFEDNASLLERGSHPVIQFTGAMAGALADPINLLSMTLGGAPKAGQLAKFILSETAISGGAATAAREVQAVDAAVEAGIRAELSVAADAEKAFGLDGIEAAGWVRELSGRQPFADLDEGYRLAAEVQARLADEGERIADELGIEFKDPGLKAREDAEEKLGRKRYNAVNRLTDISRGGFVVPEIGRADEVVARLAQVFDIVDETWSIKPGTNYVDRKVIIRHPDGMLSEVQIWTPEVYKVKVAETDAYKAVRGKPDDDPEVMALVAQSRAAYSAAIEADGFNLAMFNPRGTSSAPKLFAKAAAKASDDVPPGAVRATSSASTRTQSSPGSRTATAESRPDASSASIAGRPSQLQKSSRVMGEDPSIKDSPSLEADGPDVNSLRADLAAVLDDTISTGDGSFTVRQLLDDIEADRDLADVMEVCRMKGQPQ